MGGGTDDVSFFNRAPLVTLLIMQVLAQRYDAPHINLHHLMSWSVLGRAGTLSRMMRQQQMSNKWTMLSRFYQARKTLGTGPINKTGPDR